MDTEKHPIFNGVKLWGRSLPNRTVVAPMSRVSADPEGLATSEMAKYYSAFAAGGFGIIITEGIYTDENGSKAYANQPGLVTKAQKEAWEVVIKQVKQYPALFIAQLMHAGALSQFSDQTCAPSSIRPAGSKMAQFGGEGFYPVPREMNSKEIEQVKQGFVNAAINACEAGFDGVELHAANGYLLDQFLTPELNNRTDLYGGDTQNRFRIISEIVTEIRINIPSGFIIGLRLSEGKVNDLTYRWKDEHITATEILTEVKLSSLDFVHTAVQSGEWERDSFYSNGDSLAALARRVTGIPVIANGGLHQLDKAKRVLNENHADLIAIGKAALADPNWPVNVQHLKPVIEFHRDMLWPVAGISHSQRVIERLQQQALYSE